MAEGGWRLVAWGFVLAEAPVPEVTGSGLLVADTLGGGVRRVGHDGDPGAGELLAGRRGIGGLAHAAGGGLVATGRDVVVLRGTATEPSTVVSGGDGITGYNDLTVTPEGWLLVGALRYRPFAGDPPTPGDLILVREGEVTTWDTGSLTWPNGLGFSQQAHVVYAADFATGVIHRAAWHDGQPAALQPWVSSPSGQADGLDVDAADRVWVAIGAGAGVAIYSPTGELEGVLEVPARFVSSCCHAGADLRTLAVTTADNTADPARGGSVFITRVDVPGLPARQAHL